MWFFFTRIPLTYQSQQDGFLSARVESPELSGFFLPRSSSGNPPLQGFKAAIHEWVNYFTVHIYLFE